MYIYMYTHCLCIWIFYMTKCMPSGRKYKCCHSNGTNDQLFKQKRNFLFILQCAIIFSTSFSRIPPKCYFFKKMIIKTKHDQKTETNPLTNQPNKQQCPPTPNIPKMSSYLQFDILMQLCLLRDFRQQSLSILGFFSRLTFTKISKLLFKSSIREILF